MADQWHVIHNGKRFGPVPLERLKQLVNQGKLLKSDLVRENGAGPWIPLARALSGAAPSAEPVPPQAAQRGKPWAVVAVGSAVAAVALVSAAWFMSRGALPGAPPPPDVALQEGAAQDVALPDHALTAARPVTPTGDAAPSATIVPNTTAAADSPKDSSTNSPGGESAAATDAAVAESAAANTTDPAKTAEEKPDIPPGDQRLADLVEKCMPSCVKILNFGKDGGRSTGSGFVVDAQGIIATNHHVVKDAASLVCTFSDGSEAKSPGFFLVDPRRDLALIYCDPRSHAMTPLPRAETLPRQGESIFTIGSPLGLSFRISSGVISGLCHTAEVAGELRPTLGIDLNEVLGQDVMWLQTDAAISHGNSGGPWFNLQGEVIGVCTWGVPGSSSLSFGSAVGELDQLIERLPGEAVKPWSELPTDQQAESDEPEDPADRIVFPRSVTLPSGREIPILDALGADDVLSAARWPKREAARGDELLELKGPDDTRLGRASYRNFQLDGISVLRGKQRRLWLLANFVDGRRQGYHVLCDEQARPVLLAQFEDHKRHGVSCYLRGGETYAVQEFSRGKATATHLFVADEVLEGVALTDERFPEAADAAAYIQQTDDAWHQADAMLRQTFEKQIEPERKLRTQRRRAAGG